MSKPYIFEVRDPENPAEGKVKAVIPGWYYAKLYKEKFVQYENLRAAKYVLDNVKRIFGKVRVFNEGGWCYVGRPETWFVSERVTAPFPEHLVFAVYFNPRMHLYEFRAERRAQDDEFNPLDWESRYGSLVWKATS